MTDSIRLSKRMTELGLCSRREADEFIEQGWVRVDGQVVDVLGSRVFPHQKIELQRRATAVQAERVTILLHKPAGFLAGPGEPGIRPAWQLVKPETHFAGDRSGIHPLKRHFSHLAAAGWLDLAASGLLVLTQDGRVAKALLADDLDYEKEYQVRVAGTITEEMVSLLNRTYTIDGVTWKAAKVSQQSDAQLRFVLRESHKKQIQELCEAVGLRVVSIKRLRIGRIGLKDLPEGQWRFLGQNERF
ncbi:pseudouridine synthase [Jeongeupia chitinilytica]|uniref:Dual-specificity RNA pseudouridine synthase RluF n=1 Tax=Jeongeupia chitinilytica TaxID=1041641 RepID=A0ABQ3GWS3_9NEIS|nr:RNA pseudouridine synthase [Jeongeupia chitinilytica]GHD56474.1 RNA pseudouridylate synthase [Jeongeupia chitinilytica]